MTTLTQSQVRDDGEWPRAWDGAEDGSGGGAPHPQHGLPLGDALLPLHGHRHVRRVGAVGLPGQRLFLRNIASKGQKSILFFTCFVCRKCTQISRFNLLFVVYSMSDILSWLKTAQVNRLDILLELFFSNSDWPWRLCPRSSFSEKFWGGSEADKPI